MTGRAYGLQDYSRNIKPVTMAAKEMDIDYVLKLENQLCFPLYACAKEIVKGYKSLLDAIDLTYTQYITMMVIWEEKSINVKELGHRLHLDSGTLTPLLKRLQAKKLITRKRSMDDERQLIISLTETGEALKFKASHIPIDMGHNIDITSDEYWFLYNILYKMLGQLSNKEEER